MTELSTGSLSFAPVNRISAPGGQRIGSQGSLSKKYLPAFFGGLIRLTDFVILCAVYRVLLLGTRYPSGTEGLIEIALLALLTQILFQRANLYYLRRIHQPASFMSPLAFVWLSVGVIIAILHPPLRLSDNVTLASFSTCIIVAFIGFTVTRLAVFRRIDNLYDAGRMATSVAVIGTESAIRWLDGCLSPEIGTSINVIATFPLCRSQVPPASEIVRLCRTEQISEVLVPVDGQIDQDVNALLRELGGLAITVRLVPRLSEASSPFSRPQILYGVPTIPVIRPPLSNLDLIAKRSLDLLLSAGAIFLFLPLLVIIAALIKIDSPGPILFRQERWGVNCRPITVLKFRTMFCDPSPDSDVMQARKADPRVSRVGRFLRRSSLDELPQLFNVLTGQMSLVGPRPHANAHNEFYAPRVENYIGRHRLKPGITGLAQINGCRGETDTIDKMKKRVEYDLYYIEHWSLWLDLKILLKTSAVGFFHPNAY